jgi:hypothetical protein
LICGNDATHHHFDEPQYFSDDSLYLKGIDWYTSIYLRPSGADSIVHHKSPLILFDKSPTYLDHPLAPHRAHSLLPRAKLIINLADPSRRAYSWYQHRRAHNGELSLHYNFTEVLNAFTPSPSTPPSLTDLLNDCLSPGHYYKHITHWLRYYDIKQLLLLDSDDIVKRPADVMDMIQKFLNIQHFDYHKILQFDREKGFYCVVQKGKVKCLVSVCCLPHC